MSKEDEELFVPLERFGLGPTINPNPSDDLGQDPFRMSALHAHALQRVFDPLHFNVHDLDLFISGKDVSNTYLNLFIGGVGYPSNNSLYLTLWNQGLGGGLDLFIGGYGVTEGYNPYNETLNLFLARPTTNVLDLSILGPGYPYNNDLDLYIGGKQFYANGYGGGLLSNPSLNLVLWSNDVVGSLDMFISGF